MVKLINCIIVLVFLILYSLFFLPQHTFATTTLYFGSIEKTYDDLGNIVEEKVYIPAGNSTVLLQYRVRPSDTDNPRSDPESKDQQPMTISRLSYLFSDHLGSTVLVTDNQGNITDSMMYYPYGNLVNEQRVRPFDADSARSDPDLTDKLYT